MSALARPQQLTPRHRGVYKFRGKIFGRNAYYALTSSGEILGNCLRVVSDHEVDAAIVSKLFVDLDRTDPVKPPLQLVRPVVAGSIDGPSLSHPQLTVVHGERAIPFQTLATRWHDLEPARHPVHTTHDDVYVSLFRSLYGRDPAPLQRRATPGRDHSLVPLP